MRAVLVVGDPRERLGAADEDVAGAAALDQRGGVVEPVEEAGAGGVEVDDAGVRGADPGARRAGARPGVSRSGVIVAMITWSTSGAVDAGVGEGGVARLRGERRRAVAAGR